MRTGTDPELRSFVANARRGVLATVTGSGQPRLVPICFAMTVEPSATPGNFVLYSALDEKPKRSADPLALARVRDLQARPLAAVLVDRWSEDWRRLAWVRLHCRGEVVPPDAHAHESAAREPPVGEHVRAVAALRDKYPQYRDQRLESRPLIRLTCSVAATWGAIGEGDDQPTTKRNDDPKRRTHDA